VSTSRPLARGRPETVSRGSARSRSGIMRWSTRGSLVNPQRSIPAKIVQLTGITNEMVREAPVFFEIAESFLAFGRRHLRRP
jgi:DNA polymerase III epsilon subunit-like protein